MGAEQTARAAGGGSRITATLGLLRQYIKEQGGGVTTMSLMPGGAIDGSGVAEEEMKTMELFPQQAGMLKHPQERREPESAQLTIFYGGRAMVFDDFPAEKAKELMQLASSCNPPAASDAGATAVCQQDAPGQQPCWPDLPIARKASLQRFLEKRKSRLAAAEPYSVDSAPAAAVKEASNKPVKDDGAPWLGVNNSRLDLNRII